MMVVEDVCVLITKVMARYATNQNLRYLHSFAFRWPRNSNLNVLVSEANYSFLWIINSVVSSSALMCG